MYKPISLLLVLVLFVSCKQKNTSQPTEGWIVLFDGSSLNNWRGYLKDGMPEEWSIEGDAMAFSPSGKSANIITKNTYTNFMLSLEWKISEAGNSGIFWGIHEDKSLGQPYHSGPEIQVIDNEKHPDAKVKPKYHQAGALYDMVQPLQDVCKPAGEWNLCEIMIDRNNNKGFAKLNGVLVAEFPLHGEAWDEMVANSKFKGWKHFGKYSTGHIGLQDHGDKVWYRNIKIKPL